MIYMKKIQSANELLEKVKKSERKKLEKIIFFDYNVFKEFKKLAPEEIQNKRIIPIKKTKKIFISNENDIFLGYDSLNESFVLICNYISKNLYILKSFRYINKIEKKDINYEINSIINFIVLLKLKFNSRLR